MLGIYCLMAGACFWQWMNEWLSNRYLYFYSTLVKVSFIYLFLIWYCHFTKIIYSPFSFPEVEPGRTKFQVPRAIREILTSNALSPCWTWTGATDLFAWLIPSSTNPRRDGRCNLLTPSLPSISWVGLIHFVLLKFILEWSCIRFRSLRFYIIYLLAIRPLKDVCEIDRLNSLFF